MAVAFEEIVSASGWIGQVHGRQLGGPEETISHAVAEWES